MDIRLASNGLLFDLTLDGADLAPDTSLETAVLLSLFTDRRAEPGDVPAGEDPKGWWGDSYAQSDDRIGSRLWLLKRSKLLPETAERARGYARESLQWLLDDGITSDVSVTAELHRPDRLNLSVILRRPDGRQESYQYPDLWETLKHGV
ncbi:phage GP46 family protein [uncultured Endozoicomonas sp.]|uniref:phage GP46 family protein n=1 Tax=uncultured Endozoicomonas sp. TaxID=432652 RepID=UPI002605D59D|nr:phage GP46 family protein [uncultured Endozoicomonas sp.]